MEKIGSIERVKTEVPHREIEYPAYNKQKKG